MWRFWAVHARLRFHMFVPQNGERVKSTHSNPHWPHIVWWGFDSTACPVSREIEFWDALLLCPHPYPGWGSGAKHRCISPRSLTADQPTSLCKFPTVMIECLTRDVIIVAFDCTWTETTQHMFNKLVTILHNTKEFTYLIYIPYLHRMLHCYGHHQCHYKLWFATTIQS